MVIAPPRPTEQLKLDQARIKSWQEWKSEGVPIEYVNRLQSPDGLTREEWETTINYLLTDTHAAVMTARLQWMRRLEGFGLKPTRILAFERGDGEMRWYFTPKGWMKRPYGQSRKGKYRKWEEWEGQGVRIQHTGFQFKSEEQETVLAFIDTEPLMEINTFIKAWHRRLEAEGARPESIDAALDGHGEFRFYLVPKGWVKLPGPGRTSRK